MEMIEQSGVRMNGTRLHVLPFRNDDPRAAVGRCASLLEAEELQGKPLNERRRRFGQRPLPDFEPVLTRGESLESLHELAKLEGMERNCEQCGKRMQNRRGRVAFPICYACRLANGEAR